MIQGAINIILKINEHIAPQISNTTNNECVYWLFSTLIQSLAAIVGFSIASYCFIINKIDDKIERDSSLLEILVSSKKRLFKYFIWICILSLISIVLGVFSLIINGNYDVLIIKMNILKISILIYYVVSLVVGVLTIIYILIFMVITCNPNMVDNEIKTMIENDKNIDKELEKAKDLQEFIMEFIKLEKILRDKYGESTIIDKKSSRFKSLRDLYKEMLDMNFIDFKTYIEFDEINKIRNLAAHGRVTKINEDIYNNLVKHIEIIEEIDFNKLIVKKVFSIRRSKNDKNNKKLLLYVILINKISYKFPVQIEYSDDSDYEYLNRCIKESINRLKPEKYSYNEITWNLLLEKQIKEYDIGIEIEKYFNGNKIGEDGSLYKFFTERKEHDMKFKTIRSNSARLTSSS